MKHWNQKTYTLQLKHHEDSVIVWGCMSAAGVGSLQIINKTSNHRIYIDILKCNLLSNAERMGIKDDFVFMHDNNPGHTVYNIRMWILHNTPAYLKTPLKPPDINPIEQLWDYLACQLRKYKISLKKDLKKFLLEWNKVLSHITSKLVNSMPARRAEIINLKGYPIKY